MTPVTTEIFCCSECLRNVVQAQLQMCWIGLIRETQSYVLFTLQPNNVYSVQTEALFKLELQFIKLDILMAIFKYKTGIHTNLSRKSYCIVAMNLRNLSQFKEGHI